MFHQFPDRRKALSVLNPRNRLVNFRLSPDEVHQLEVACTVSGARSLSDFARTAVLTATASALNSFPTQSDVSSGQMERVDAVVDHVELRLNQILQLLDVVQDQTKRQELVEDS